ncbi:hypothetical protein ABGB07_31975 [Micromonosporaceae bacterium B7E4]
MIADAVQRLRTAAKIRSRLVADCRVAVQRTLLVVRLLDLGLG